MTTTEQTQSTQIIDIANFHSPGNIHVLDDISEMNMDDAIVTLESMMREGNSTEPSKELVRMIERKYPDISESLSEKYKQELKIYMNS